MRLTTTADGSQLAPLCGVVVEELKRILGDVCSNPSHPVFNHYLFETVAALVKRICAVNPAAVDAFEAALFPPFETVLGMDVAEFTPYVFQIFAQLLDLKTGALSPPYQVLFPHLLKPEVWERRGNVPALSRLVRSYVRKAVPEVEGRLEALLGIFQKLVAKKSTELEAFQLLSSIFAAFPLDKMVVYLLDMIRILLQRWQNNKTRRYSTALISALSGLAVVHGPAILVQKMDGATRAGGRCCRVPPLLTWAWPLDPSWAAELQPGCFGQFFTAVWLDNLGAVVGVEERALVSAATAKILTEPTPFFASPEHVAAWPRGMEGVVLLLEHADGSSAGANGVDEGGDDDGLGVDLSTGEGSGYSAAYARLHFAAEQATPLLPPGTDVRSLVARGVQQACAAKPGQLMAPLLAFSAASTALPGGALQMVRRASSPCHGHVRSCGPSRPSRAAPLSVFPARWH